MVKFNSLENTKKQYPHFFDKEDDTNFTKHLKVVNNQQQEVRHNLKNVEWSRLLEKPLQIWRTQTEPYNYDINIKVNVPNIQTITVYHNPVIKDNQIISFTDKIIDEKFEYEDNAKTFEKTVNDITVKPYDIIVTENVVFDNEFINAHSLSNYTVVDELPEPSRDDYGINYFVLNNDAYDSYTVEELPYLIIYENVIETITPNLYLGEDWHIGFKTSEEFNGQIVIGEENEQFSLWHNGSEWHVECRKSGDEWTLSVTNNEVHTWEITYPKINLAEHMLGDVVPVEIIVDVDNNTHKYITDYTITDDDLENGKFNSGMLKEITLSAESSINDFCCYNNEQKSYEFVMNCTEIPYTIHTDTTELKHIIPNDTYLLEVTTYDDYQYWKGYPENDYSVKEDNILQYQYNTTFLDISLETISYKRYLVFRVHKNNLKKVNILKNDKIVFTQTLESWKIQDKDSTDFSHYYYGAEDEGNFKQYFEIEDKEPNRELVYFTKEQDEYVFYYPLSDDKLVLCFTDYPDKEDYIIDKTNTVNPSEDTLQKIVIKLEDGHYNSYKTVKNDDDYEFQGLKSKLEHDYIVKDIFDLEAYTVENRYRCREDYERKYTKRYNGYDKQTNDCFDHDYSLDIIGTLLNVPRYRLYKTYREDENYLSRTYPPFYDRPTEDDYHYMKRMQEYIRQYNHTPFPVLECWKYYQIKPTLRSRKEIIGVMDETSLRYNGSDIICDSDFMESLTEYDTNEEIMSYSINKATQSKGDGLQVTRGDKTWYETVIVNNCYIVPNTSYRLRYGLDSEAEDVSIRMICYNRDGGVIRSVPVLSENHDEPTEMYNVTTGYDYTDTMLITPKDTVYIKLLLESNNPFKYCDVSFERMKMIRYDNMYMGTSEDYNGNFYEFYCNYEDVPTNIHLDSGKRFSALLQRSLPLTKKGLLYMDILESLENSANFTTSLELYGSNLLIHDDNTNQTSKTINNSISYYEEVDNRLLKKNEDYELGIKFHMDRTLDDEPLSLDVYNTSKWNGNATIESENTVKVSAINNVLLKEEFTSSEKYTLTFKITCEVSDRQGIYLFGNSQGNKLFGVVTDISNTFIEQYDTNGRATLLYTTDTNYFTMGTHDIKVIRNGPTAKLYFDGDMIYTFTGLTDCKNIIGMWKWLIRSISLNDVKLLIEENNLMSAEVEFKDQNDNETGHIILDDRIYSDTEAHISYDFTTPSDIEWDKMFIRIQSEVETELEKITLKTKNKLL